MRTAVHGHGVGAGVRDSWFKSALRAGASALVVGSAISGSGAWAQEQAQPEPEVEDTTAVEQPVNEIVVSGLRASLANAQNV